MQTYHSYSRISLDNSIFNFVTYLEGDEEKKGVVLFCAGSGGQYIEPKSPLSESQVAKIIVQLRKVIANSYKGKIKVRCGFVNVSLRFFGKKENDKIKLMAYLSGFLFFSTSSFGSRVSISDVNRLAERLIELQS